MSTSCYIGVKLDIGGFLYTRCNFDGYPGNIVPALANYTTTEQAHKLVAGGEIRSMSTTEVEYYSDAMELCPWTAESVPVDECYTYYWEDGNWWMVVEGSRVNIEAVEFT